VPDDDHLKIVALAGGVGGAKLADGLAQVLQPEQLTIIVNTADDFTHLGLRISPDLDTVCYTLAGLANPETGWGRINETWNVFESLKKLGMPNWFQLGDSDIATHLVRTIWLGEGRKLSQITLDLCKMWGIQVKVLPMTDDVVQTWVYSNEGDLEFQEYFVHQQCDPIIKGIRFEGAEKSTPAPGILDAIEQGDAVVICPSNPWVSIDPILSIPNIKTALENHFVLAVSPIIGGKAIKGPASKMFSELGIQPSALAVAKHYEGIIQRIVIDNSDQTFEREINQLKISTLTTNILMHVRSDRRRLAGEIILDINASLKR
jgi:LPPG:FO 2-phospho-L-lactate transferase